MDYRGLNPKIEFGGTKVEDFPELENGFQINKHFLADGSLHESSLQIYALEDSIYIDMQENHFSYVKSMEEYAKKSVLSVIIISFSGSRLQCSKQGQQGCELR